MKRTSKEAHVYMRRHQGVKCKHFDVSDVIYHKFSHGAASYNIGYFHIILSKYVLLNKKTRKTLTIIIVIIKIIIIKESNIIMNERKKVERGKMTNNNNNNNNDNNK